MNKRLPLCIILFSSLVGCGGPLGKWELQRDTVGDVNSATGRQYVETVIKDGVEYQIEHSGAHPAISWAVGPNRLDAMMKNISDVVDYGTIHTLQGDRYIFLKECKGVATVGDEKYAPLERLDVIFWIFEYADKDTLYIFRDVDMNGWKFKTFIVVASYLRKTGNYAHWIEQRTNRRSEIKYCLD